MITMYGIANCDTIKKARRWLDERGIEYVFHDVKKLGLDEALLRSWVDELGWEALLNKRGMMWRRLDAATREQIDRDSAIAVMLETPAIIRRPVLDTGAKRMIGFSEQTYGAALQ